MVIISPFTQSWISLATTTRALRTSLTYHSIYIFRYLLNLQISDPYQYHLMVSYITSLNNALDQRLNWSKDIGISVAEARRETVKFSLLQYWLHKFSPEKLYILANLKHTKICMALENIPEPVTVSVSKKNYFYYYSVTFELIRISYCNLA